MALAVQAFVQHDAEPAAPVHAPPLHVWFGVVWILQPFESFVQVTQLVPLAQVGPLVPLQTWSVLHVQAEELPVPVHVWFIPQVVVVTHAVQPLA